MHEGRRHNAVIDVSVIVTVVALGVVAAGLLHSPESELPPGNAVSSGEAARDGDYSIVSEPVEYPVDIPGCSEVEPPPPSEDGRLISVIGSQAPSYDNPAYPWLTASKAGAMTDALVGALPADVTVKLAAPSQSLTFQPVDDFGGNVPEGLEASTSARGDLTRAGVSAFASVDVRPSSTGIPACVAGVLDARTTEPDGTVVDTDDSWYEIGGDRTNSRRATAYHPDGTLVTANLSTTVGPEFPLDTSELTRIAALPDLRVGSPAPAGNAEPRQDCSVSLAGEATAVDIDEESLDAANEALTTTWQALPDAPVLNRPIGSLVPDRTGRGACTDIDVVNSDVALSISVSSGAALPVARDPYDPENAYEPVVELRTLPDGSVLESYDVDLSSSMTAEDGTMRLARSVTLTRPSGVQVSVRSTADFVPGGGRSTRPEPLPLELLDAVAQAPITEWP
ncbi:hypothetical protein [Rhodococcoides fascians]|uniref:hypothetical protein n=1 Tax=Rhodococcoides fascians TaxID=1828 RepID=UPI001DA43411|nr:hypothetical protein [Rhodococcus fascians]CAH0140849.1 hypothetical protein SRABI91_00473 [Rhodococcus fascians]